LKRFSTSRSNGGALLIVLILNVAFAFLLMFVLQQSHLQTRAARIRTESIAALHTAHAELALARLLISESGYTDGKNDVIHAALAAADSRIEETEVTVTKMTGETGTWYQLTAEIPYEEGYSRVVSQPVREIDYFSSYNLFVGEHPAGVSGEPLGEIHSNKSVQFYFPGGRYVNPVSAVEGVEYRAGADPDNTTIIGGLNGAAERVDLTDYIGGDTYFAETKVDALTGFSFPADVDVKIAFSRESDGQWVEIETWTKPRLETTTVDVVIDVLKTNPREETYTYDEKVVVGYTDEVRQVRVVDYYETKSKDVHKPRYVYEDRTRTVLKKVWVDDAAGGGTSVGGESDSAGHYEYREIVETYQEKILDGYDTITKTWEAPVYKTVDETYQVPITETVTKTGTRTVYDEEEVWGQQEKTTYVAPKLISRNTTQAPTNGLIFAEGDVLSVKGVVTGRVSVITEGSIRITDSLVYEDEYGQTPYLNGTDPTKDYQPNSSYKGAAALGLIAKNDILYSREIPERLEVNASMAAVTGRIGIEGVTLDADGAVAEFNLHVDEYGNVQTKPFVRESLRRLGGITTALRPVESVVSTGKIASGFQMGRSVFDKSVIAGPPPYYMSYESPRFFPKQVVK